MQALRKEFDKMPQYMHHLEFPPGDVSTIIIKLENGKKIAVHNLDDFWDTLSKVNLK